MANKLRGNSALQERMGQILPRTEFRKMVDVEDREAVFRLRYEGYKRSYGLNDDWGGFDADELDDKPNTDTFGIFIGGKLVSTVRLSVLTTDCPHAHGLDAYPDLVGPRVRDNWVIVDSSRFVIDMQSIAQFPELPYLTMKIPIMSCLHYGADECMTAVRKEHVAFYRRLFNAEAVGEEVYYEPLKANVQLLVTTCDGMYDDLDERFPFFRSNYFERRQLFGPADAMPGVHEVKNKAA